MTALIGPSEAFILGAGAGIISMLFYRWFGRLEDDPAVREALADPDRRPARGAAPDPQRSAAGRAGAAVTNAKRRAAAAAQRRFVLEVAEQMRRDAAAKKEQMQ